METDVRKILQGLADTATNAAGEARSAVQSAKKVMSDKYDEVRLNAEVSRLNAQQERLFADIGRTLFLVQCGTVRADEIDAENENVKTPHQTIDALLMEAAQLQHELDTAAEKLAAAQNKRLCPGCGRACREADAFCSVCGGKL